MERSRQGTTSKTPKRREEGRGCKRGGKKPRAAFHKTLYGKGGKQEQRSQRKTHQKKIGIKGIPKSIWDVRGGGWDNEKGVLRKAGRVKNEKKKKQKKKKGKQKTSEKRTTPVHA